MENEAAATVLALVQSLGDERATVRDTAANALGRIGEAAQAAIAALAQTMRDPDARVRAAAARVLVAMGPVAAPSLALVLNDCNPAVRELAAHSLRLLGSRTGDR